MIYDSDWEATALIGRHKMNLMGISRTIEIEIAFGIHLSVTRRYQVRVNLKRTLIGNPPYCIKNKEIVRPLVSGERGEDDASATSDLGNSLEDFENDVVT